MNAWLIDHCRAKARYTAIATGYNLGAAAFAGTGPIIATQLVRRSESYGRGWMSEHNKTKLPKAIPKLGQEVMLVAWSLFHTIPPGRPTPTRHNYYSNTPTPFAECSFFCVLGGAAEMFTAVGWYVSGVALLSFLTVTATYLLQDRKTKEAVHEKVGQVVSGVVG